MAICPNRPKPMTSTLPVRPSGSSTPSIDCSSLGMTKRRPMIENGVRIIEMMTVAVKIALRSEVKMPLPSAVV
ncbi:hypothetical protein D3C85_1900660 [compost metagenome]